LKRRLDIAEIVRKNGEIKVDSLAEMLDVSGVTIRNDLNYLEQQGYLKRSFGGAIYTAQQTPVVQSREPVPVATDKMLEAEIARQVAVHIENHETVFLGPGAILRKVIPFLADRDDLCLVLNDLAHITFAREYINGETVLLGGVLGEEGKTVEGELASAALRQYRPSCAVISVEHIAEDGTLSIRSESAAHLLAGAIAQSGSAIAIVPSRPVYGDKRYAIGKIDDLRCVITPQIVAAEYHSRFLSAGLTNSYTNNECLTWLNPALPKVR
jgi:DeoR/GlpR family transcriptional regulator of sugar metabolism